MPKSKVNRTAKAFARPQLHTENPENTPPALTHPGDMRVAPTSGTDAPRVPAPGPESNGQSTPTHLKPGGTDGATPAAKIEISEKVKELVRLAQEQGYL